MALEARSAAWDVERELDREVPSGASGGTSGPRADFLANLGRRVAELGSMLTALEGEPASVRLRDDLRRRLHALGAGGRLLRFDRLAAEVAAAEDLLGEVAERGGLSGADAAALRAALVKLPGLSFTANDAEGAGGGARTPSASGPPAAKAAERAEVAAPPWPLSVLVVGPKPIADALVAGAAEGSATIDVERTEDSLRAIDLARAVAPDVVVIDADLRGSRELLAAVRKDPLTAGVAIVALGTWARTEDATPYLAAGATRAVLKPVSPEALRRVCREASADRAGAVSPACDLGSVSVQELAARLGQEVERAIVDGAAAREDARVDLGRGDDVIGAVWAAAARVRDMVTIRSRGEIRFAPGNAERAVPVGAWMNDGAPAPGTSSASAPRRGGVVATRALAGAHILVADDDPAVAWFLSGVLRGEGATVSEACDGAVALRKAMEQSPDIVLSDVLMPNLDGLTLTDTLRADPLLSDVAVILLSWKEDLLQRARELGARADAYLRKDASGPTVAQRARELYYPRARLAERLAAGGEVHGRVDGLTMRTLLKLVCTHRPACLLEVRDAAYLYEVQIDGGRPTNVTRSAKDGTFVGGAIAFARLLGVRAGRFAVAAPRAASSGEAALSGSLVEQIRPHAAAARGALELLTGATLGQVARIGFDDDWLTGYGALAPEPARALVRRLAAGEAPRKLLGSGLASGRLFEEVVRDAAARGAIAEVAGSQGEDLLGPAVAKSLALLLGQKPSVPPPAAETDGEIPVDEVSPSGVIVAPAAIEGAAMAPAPGLLASATADALAARGVMTVAPPSVAVAAATAADGGTVVGAPSGDLSEAPSAAALRPQAPLLTLGSLTPPPSAPRIEPPAPKAPVIKIGKGAAAAAIAIDEDDEESPAPRRSKRQSERAAETPEPPKVKAPQNRMGIWVMCAVAGVVFAVGARISQERRAQAPAAPPAAAVVAAPPASAQAATGATAAAPQGTGMAGAAGAATPAPAPSISVPGDSESDPILPQEAPLRSDEKIPKGQGMLEVIVGPNDQVSIDGHSTVAGPVVKATLAPREKAYEIKVKMKGEERVRFALVKEGKRTRVRVAPPWNR